MHPLLFLYGSEDVFLIDYCVFNTFVLEIVSAVSAEDYDIADLEQHRFFFCARTYSEDFSLLRLFLCASGQQQSCFRFFFGLHFLDNYSCSERFDSNAHFLPPDQFYLLAL